jgi:hypothetical protein
VARDGIILLMTGIDASLSAHGKRSDISKAMNIAGKAMGG